jgi:hypothetical protein
VGHDADPGGRRNAEDVSAVQLLIALWLSAFTVAAAGFDAAHAPIVKTGDHVDLRYVGRVSAAEGPTDLAARFQVVALSATTAAVTIDANGQTHKFPAVLHPDGTLTTTSSPSDLLPQYNVIPLLLLSGAAHAGDANATWSAGIPVKISETEYQILPVRVVSTTRGDRMQLDATGHKSLLVSTRGFTVSEDVTVKGRAEFDHGALASSHFNVRLVVHAFKDIPLSYDWTMSPQP